MAQAAADMIEKHSWPSFFVKSMIFLASILLRKHLSRQEETMILLLALIEYMQTR